MKKIGLISDTHGYLDKTVFTHFDQCDEIWHAGDIGTSEVADELIQFRPLRAVWGNIDASELRRRFPEHQRFTCEGVDVWITHIGGYPPRYTKEVRAAFGATPPGLFIAGHSHILRVMRDPKWHNMLFMNPGAAGQQGFHRMRTILRFQVADGEISQVEAIELGRRGQILS